MLQTGHSAIPLCRYEAYWKQLHKHKLSIAFLRQCQIIPVIVNRIPNVTVGRMCWHKVTTFCCCLKIKTGAWVVSICSLCLSIFVLVENLILPDYSAMWAQDLIQKLRLEEPLDHRIMISVILGIGNTAVFGIQFKNPQISKQKEKDPLISWRIIANYNNAKQMSNPIFTGLVDYGAHSNVFFATYYANS